MMTKERKTTRRLFLLLQMLLLATTALPQKGSTSGELRGELESGEIVTAKYSLSPQMGENRKENTFASYGARIKKGAAITVYGSVSKEMRISVSFKCFNENGQPLDHDGKPWGEQNRWGKSGYGNELSYSFTPPEGTDRIEGSMTFGWGGMELALYYRVGDLSEEGGNEEGGDEEEEGGDEEEEWDEGDYEDYEEDNDAKEESGFKDYIIPGVIGVILLGGGAAVANNKRKKKKKKAPQPPKGGATPAGDSGDSGGDEEDKQPDQLRMEVHKDFGDTLVVGDKPQQLSARIVRYPADGPEYVDMELTEKIQIVSGDEYLDVQDAGIAGDSKCAFVSAPECEGSAPEEGVVDFRMVSEGGSYTNHLHFKILQGQIGFGQDDLTIPAFYKEEMALQFVVIGMDENDCKVSLQLQPCSFQENVQTHQSAKGDYSVTPRWNAEKETWEAVFKDQWLDDKAEDHTAGDLYGYKLYVEAKSKDGLTIKGELPVFRMYMGLGLRMADNGEVGCYVEPYDPAHHIDSQAVVKQDGREMTPAETRCVLVFYDWDEEEHKVITRYPEIDPDGVKFVAPDKECQDMVNKLGLYFQYQLTSKGKPYYILRCRNAVLSAPNRFGINVELKVQYKSKHQEVSSTCTRPLFLLSQPRRHFDSPNAQDAADKNDNQIRESYYRLEDIIIFRGYLDRLEPLLAAIRIQLKYYDKAFGFDEHNRKQIFAVYHHVVEGEQLEANGHALVACDNLNEVCIEAFRATRKGLRDLHWMDRLFLGVVTGGVSEMFFGVVSGMGAVQDYVDEGGDNYFGAFTMGAWEVTKQYLFEKALSGVVNYGKHYLKYLGNFSKANVAWKKEMGEMLAKEVGDAGQWLKGGANKIVDKALSIKDWFVTRGNASRTADLTRAAAGNARSELIAVKAGVTPKKPGLDISDKVLDEFEERAADTINELRLAVWLNKLHASEANERLLNRAIVKLQSDKNAMMKFKQMLSQGDASKAAAGDVSLQHAAKVFNGRKSSAADWVDEAMKRDLSKLKPGLRPEDVHVGKVSSSKAAELKDGKTITFDSDVNYYYLDKNGNKVFFDQRPTENLLNKNYREYWSRHTDGPQQPIDTSNMTPAQVRKLKLLEERLNKEFTKEHMDQTVVQDPLRDPISYGPKQNLEAMIDPAHQGERLGDVDKAAEAVLNKPMEWFRRGMEELEKSLKTADSAEQSNLAYEAVGYLKEGCRQVVKIIDLLNKRAIHRTSEDVVSKIPKKLREGSELMRFMTEGGEANIKQVYQGLVNKGLNFEEVSYELYRTLKAMK